MTHEFNELDTVKAVNPFLRPQESDKHSSGEGRGFAGEFVNSLLYMGVVDPLKSIAQVVDNSGTRFSSVVTSLAGSVGIERPQGTQFGSDDWYGQNLGGAIGMLIPVKVAHSLVGGRSAMAFNKAAGIQAGMTPSLRMLAAREATTMAATGAFYGTFLRASNDQNVGSWNFLLDRGVQGLSDGAIFGTLGGSSPFISRGLSTTFSAVERSTTLPLAQFAQPNALTGRLATGAISAVPAGLVAAESHALQDGRWIPTTDEATQSVAAMAFVGTTLGGAQWAGAQRPGTYNTNARHLTDTLGVTKPVAGSATFRIVEGQKAYEGFVKDVARGSESAEATITVQPHVNTAAGGLIGRIFGPTIGSRLTTLGEAQSLTLMHRGLNSTVRANEVTSDLVATCLSLEGAAKAKDAMPSRAQGDGRVFVQSERPGEITITSAEPAREVGLQTEAVALGGKARKTGPSERTLNSKVDVMGQELASGSIRMNFDMFGDRVSGNIGAATVTTIGITGNGWPFFEVGVGRHLWTLNGKPLQPGRNYLDINGGDVLSFNNALNLRLTPGAKAGKTQVFELRPEHLIPEGQRGFRDVDAQITVQGQRLNPNEEIFIGADGKPIEKPPEVIDALAESISFSVATGTRGLPEASTPEGAIGAIGRRPDGRLYFRATRGIDAYINGQKVTDAEVPFGSQDYVTVGDGVRLTVNNYGQQLPEPAPKPERAPREPRLQEDGGEGRGNEGEGRGTNEGETRGTNEGETRGTNEGETRGTNEGDTNNSGEGLPRNSEGDPRGDGTVVAENGDIVDARTGIIVREAATEPGLAETGNGPNPFVDTSGPVPIIKGLDAEGRPGEVRPAEVENTPAETRVEPPVATDGTVNGAQVPQKPLGLGEAKVQAHKVSELPDSWTPTMKTMVEKAEVVQFSDGSWYPRFKSEADARTAARYFAKLVQGKRMGDHVQFAHGQVDGGYVPMVTINGSQFGVITFKPRPGEVVLGMTPPKGPASVDLVPLKKPDTAP